MIILFDYYFKTDDNMTPNKQFNTYKEGLDLKILRRYYMEYEKAKTSSYGKKLAIQMPYSIKNDTTQNRDEKCLLMTYDDKSTEEGVSMLLVWKWLMWV